MKDLDQHFKDALGQSEAPVSTEMWQRLERELPRTSLWVAYRKPVMWASSVAAVGLLLFSLVWLPDATEHLMVDPVVDIPTIAVEQPAETTPTEPAPTDPAPLEIASSTPVAAAPVKTTQAARKQPQLFVVDAPIELPIKTAADLSTTALASAEVMGSFSAPVDMESFGVEENGTTVASATNSIRTALSSALSNGIYTVASNTGMALGKANAQLEKQLHSLIPNTKEK